MDTVTETILTQGHMASMGQGPYLMACNLHRDLMSARLLLMHWLPTLLRGTLTCHSCILSHLGVGVGGTHLVCARQFRASKQSFGCLTWGRFSAHLDSRDLMSWSSESIAATHACSCVHRPLAAHPRLEPCPDWSRQPLFLFRFLQTLQAFGDPAPQQGYCS